MPYTRTTWSDYPATTTPITATALNNIESFLDGHKNLNDAWTSWTPTLTNTTAPITAAKYLQSGETIKFYVVLTLTGAQVSGLVGISLPSPALRTFSGHVTATVFDTSPGVYYVGIPVWSSVSQIDVYASNAAGTYTSTTATSSTIPMTWASGDVIYVAGTYETA